MRQRFYLDGKLTKSSNGTPERLRKWLDNMEQEWTKHGMFPLTAEGEFDLNKAHEVVRVSVDELLITTTAGKKLRIVNV